ncbi:hypothetical protein I5Q82_00575 [Acutalibacter muris]|uniref:Uncharacterized protein n=1 Tax=Acutalibacter muris TaxID=1796620 RepID=A0AA92L829_9FIRM|nr:hypothetical protein [Acutalibacter muris]QQR30278.1 hypothetical protein I5Q82_00575 [Acutalibacter muris]
MGGDRPAKAQCYWGFTVFNTEFLKQLFESFLGEIWENMEATDNSEYDTSELEGFQDDLLVAIEYLNPYPKKLDTLSYESKGAMQFVADFPCEQCGKFGVSTDETFLNIGRCCYCVYENELAKCERCGEMVNVDILEHGLCTSCTAYINRQ